MYEKSNKMRKKFVPLLAFFLSFTIFYLGYVIYFIIFANKSLAILRYAIITSASIMGLIGASINNIILDEIYVHKIMPFVKEEILNSILEKNNLAFEKINKKDKSLSDSLLISKKHRYKVLNKIVGEDIEINEISMLADMRLRGYIVKIKDELEDPITYSFTNLRYYYKHKLKDLGRTKTKHQDFDNRFKTYLSRKHTFKNENLEKILEVYPKYRYFGYSRNKGYKYVLFAYKIKDGQKLFTPQIFENIDEKFENRVKDEIKIILNFKKFDII